MSGRAIERLSGVQIFCSAPAQNSLKSPSKNEFEFDCNHFFDGLNLSGSGAKNLNTTQSLDRSTAHYLLNIYFPIFTLKHTFQEVKMYYSMHFLYVMAYLLWFIMNFGHLFHYIRVFQRKKAISDFLKLNLNLNLNSKFLEFENEFEFECNQKNTK